MVQPFQTSVALKHMLKCILEKNPNECGACGEAIFRVGSLNQHVKIHTGEKPYVCDTRGKTFSQVSQINRHFKIHTGEKPYKCDTLSSRPNKSTCYNTH